MSFNYEGLRAKDHPIPDGVTPEVLRKLREVGLKEGTPDPRDNMCRYVFDEIRISVSTQENNHSMMVVRGSTIPFNEITILHFENDPTVSLVYWHREVSVAELRSLLK